METETTDQAGQEGQDGQATGIEELKKEALLALAKAHEHLDEAKSVLTRIEHHHGFVYDGSPDGIQAEILEWVIDGLSAIDTARGYLDPTTIVHEDFSAEGILEP